MSPQLHTVLLAVLAVVILNAGILVAIRSIRNARYSVERDVQVFRYTAVVARLTLLDRRCLAWGVYLVTFGPTLSSSVQSTSALALAVLSVCLLSLVGIGYRSFSITISGSEISVRSIFRNSTVQFSELQKILVTGNSGRTLVVIDKNGKRVLSAYDDLQDFSDLIYLLKAKSAQYNVEARRKDRWGRWFDL
jgi:hypothetical protein